MPVNRPVALSAFGRAVSSSSLSGGRGLKIAQTLLPICLGAGSEKPGKGSEVEEPFRDEGIRERSNQVMQSELR
ncbi:hypothetical protein LX36DRAFT_651444 [Colletotrichum falcatum]|nr:hypothetical protein LX36DRAFT_651444 [Colletotrichum falcatum]